MHSIWISIYSTNSDRNNKAGEYEFHSILNNAPAYRNAENNYFAYDGEEWYIMSEKRFIDGISGGWFRIYSEGTLKKLE